MLSKENKVLGFILSALFLIVMIVVGIGLAVIVGRNIPHEFTAEELDASYLVSKSSYGESYKIVNGYVEQNPEQIDEDTATVYLASEEEFTGDFTSISFIRVGKDPATFEQIKAAVIQQSCGGVGYESGVVGNREYVLATCGLDLPDGTTKDFTYYVYSAGPEEQSNWIVFLTPDGVSGLSELISEYKQN